MIDRNGYAPSIMTRWEKVCFVSKAENCDLVRHEVFYGTGKRELSKKWGCWVYLRPIYHSVGKLAVHNNKELDLYLKKKVQQKFEELYSHEKFMEIFGKNYI